MRASCVHEIKSNKQRKKINEKKNNKKLAIVFAQFIKLFINSFDLLF